MRTQLKPSLNRPRDFRAFWDKTLAELAAVPAALERRPEEGIPSSGLHLESISFASLGGVRVAGYFLRSAGTEPRPLVVHSHGYGSECTVQWDWGRAGFDVVGLDIRGFGQSIFAHQQTVVALAMSSGAGLTNFKRPICTNVSGPCPSGRTVRLPSAPTTNVS